MTHREFKLWCAVYVAAITTGRSPKALADKAISEYKQSEEALKPTDK